MQMNDRLYEILIRFREGVPWAQVQRKRTWSPDEGEDPADMPPAKALPPEPVDPAGIEGLITGTQAALLAENLRIRAVLTPAQVELLGLEF